MQMKKSEVAVSGPSRAMETAPSLWARRVALVRSSGIAAKSFSACVGLTPACTTSMSTVLPGWLSRRTVRWNRPPS